MLSMTYVIARNAAGNEWIFCPKAAFENEARLRRDVRGEAMQVVREFPAPTYEAAREVYEEFMREGRELPWSEP